MKWVDIDSFSFSFFARKNATMNNTIMIDDVHGSLLKQTLMWLMKFTTYNTLTFDHHDN
jgi:hypothetical protein